MWKVIKSHPVVTALVSVGVLIGGVVGFIAALAQIWNAFSHDTVPEFLAKQQWAMTLPHWQAILAACGGLVVVVSQIAILREAYKQGRTVPSSSLSPNQEPRAVAIYEHIGAKDSPLTSQISHLFRRAGWRVDEWGTVVSKHASGVWLHGGTDLDRSVAQWGLKTLGIEADTDYENDNPPTLQLVVGLSDAAVRSLELFRNVFVNCGEGLVPIS